MGWNWVRQTTKFSETWVITRANNRQSIEAALASEPLRNAHFVYYDLPRWASFWKKGRRGIHPYYYLWQLGAYFVAKKLRQQTRFDLVHQVTLVKYPMPSFLALLPVPFLWGPVAGGDSAPRSFWYSFSLRGKVHEVARHLARGLAHFDPFVRLTARRAAACWATTPETARRVRSLGCQRVSVLQESATALDEDEIRRLGGMPARQSSPFRVASISRLDHWKGFHLGLKAFAQFHAQFPASEYWVIGDGHERKRLERLGGKLGVAEKVTFWGHMPRAQALDKLAECDVLLHPSLHESGGWVCLEAMAAGRPVICVDLGGPAIQVTERTGIKVPAISPEQVVADLAEALRQLARDPCRRARLGQAGRERAAEHFNWDKKAEYFAHIYGQLIKV